MIYTAKDIANLLKISPAAVSLVINNRQGISEATRIAVFEKISELGCDYLLKKKPVKIDTIGFVVYKRHGNIIDQSPFFSLMIESIETSSRKHGYRIVLIYIDKANRISEQIDYIQSLHCSGLIIFATEMLNEDISPFYDLDLPFVILDNYFPDTLADSVAINNEQGTYQAAKYLYDNGHRKIGYLQSKTYLTSFSERKQFFFSALRKFKVIGMERYIFHVGYPEDNAYLDFKEILDSDTELPTALFADNDLIAFGAIKALKEKGYRVPEDISVIGFDDRPICVTSEPNITTINVPKAMFGALAVDTLINRINKNYDGYIKIEIGTELVVRDSVTKPKSLPL